MVTYKALYSLISRLNLLDVLEVSMEEIVKRDNASLTSSEEDLNREILVKLARIAQATAKEFNWDANKVFLDFLKDAKIISGETTQLVNPNDSLSVLTQQLADVVKDNLSTNDIVEFVLETPESKCVEIFKDIFNNNPHLIGAANTTLSLPRRQANKLFIGESMKFLREAKADIDNFISKFGEEDYEKFVKFKDRLKNKKISTDFTYHIKNTTPEEMKDILYKVENKVETTDAYAGRKKVAENNNYTIWDIQTPEAAAKVGKGAIWCICGRYNNGYKNKDIGDMEQATHYFNQYLDEDHNYSMYLWAEPKSSKLTQYMICPFDRRGREGNADAWNPEDHQVEIGTDPDTTYSNSAEELMSLLPKFNYNGFSLELEDYVVSRDGQLRAIRTDSKDIVIPDNVKTLREKLFANRDIESIVIPGSIKEIPARCFEGCTNLRSVTLNEGTEVIGRFAFSGCSSLRTLDLPASMGTRIPARDNNAFISNVGKAAFDGCDIKVNVSKCPKIVVASQIPNMDCKDPITGEKNQEVYARAHEIFVK